MNLRYSLAIGAAVAALSAAPASAAGPVGVHAARHHCKHVKIRGHRACLGVNRYCTRQWEHAYRRHGFTCSFLDSSDRYRLRRYHRR